MVVIGCLCSEHNECAFGMLQSTMTPECDPYLAEFHQVDAFASQPFTGNPAMVYRLDSWLEDGLMQQIAAEHNLAETAFVVKKRRCLAHPLVLPRVLSCRCVVMPHLASAHVLFEVYGEPGEVLDFTCCLVRCA